MIEIDIAKLLEMCLPYLQGAGSGLAVLVAAKILGFLRIKLKVMKTGKTKVKGKRCVRFDGDRPIAVCLDAGLKDPTWFPPSKFGVSDKATADRWVKGR